KHVESRVDLPLSHATFRVVFYVTEPPLSSSTSKNIPKLHFKKSNFPHIVIGKIPHFPRSQKDFGTCYLACHQEHIRRCQSRVIVNNRLSDWFDIGIGLRQGCMLSPLLFLIFIN